MDDNMIKLTGIPTGPPVFSHESHGVKFYRLALGVKRLSGAEDTINIQAQQALTAALEPDLDGSPLSVAGHLRSFNNKSGVGSKLVLYVLAREILTADAAEPHINALKLTGTLCKNPIYRKTPLGREICDLLIAVSRYHGRSDYLPCIAWGTHARGCAELKTGDRVAVKGRLQSREYTKLENGAGATKTAFEVSASEILPIQNE
ncbi:MAG: single-stranded DNA-binding protein [Oscillospiraceae bacterium]|nr:single-stranded DNA-binding protein [Oscillospiraceae bacterium]